MANVNLSKALKMKNRLAKQIAELQRKVTEQNSHLKGAVTDYDSRALYEELQQATSRLIDLKTAISLANVPIQSTIYRLAEYKGLVAFLKKVETKRGRQLGLTSEYFVSSEVPQEYEAQITAVERDAEVERLEAEIDRLQDELDRFNATVVIEVEEE